MVKKSKRERSEPVEKAGASTDQLDALLEQAQSCADSLAFDEALEHCRAALELDPDNVAALDGMGEACVQLGDIETARQVLERSVALAPDGTATAQEAPAPCQTGAAPRGYPMGEPAVQLCTAQVQAVQHLLAHRHRARAGVHLHRGGADDGVQLVYAVRRGRVPTQLPVRNRPGDDG